MKNLIVSLFVLLLGVSASAVNQISVTIDGVTYACVGGAQPDDCVNKVALMKSKLKLCTDGGYGAMTCIDKVWPGFKANNPGCLEEGSYACLDVCQNGGYSALQCLDKCQ